LELGGGVEVLDPLLQPAAKSKRARDKNKTMASTRHLRRWVGRIRIAPKARAELHAAPSHQEVGTAIGLSFAEVVGTAAVMVRVAVLEPFTVEDAGLTPHANELEEGVQVSATGTLIP